MIVRPVDWNDTDAAALRAAMMAEMNTLYAREDDPDLDLADRDGAFGVAAEAVVSTVLVYDGADAVGHAALRRLDGELEIKRMYVTPGHRGHGIAEALLAAVEGVARDRGERRVILHTGDRQRRAIAFYRRHGYTTIPIYPPYVGLAESVCFEKVL